MQAYCFPARGQCASNRPLAPAWRWRNRISTAGLFPVLVLQNGAGEPPTLSSAVPDWRTGDTIHLGKRTLRVIGERDDDADQPPVLVIEDVGQKSV